MYNFFIIFSIRCSTKQNSIVTAKLFGCSSPSLNGKHKRQKINICLGFTIKNHAQQTNSFVVDFYLICFFFFFHTDNDFRRPEKRIKCVLLLLVFLSQCNDLRSSRKPGEKWIKSTDKMVPACLSVLVREGNVWKDRH